MAQKAEKMLLKIINKWLCNVAYNFLQEVKSDQNLFHSLNPQKIEESVDKEQASLYNMFASTQISFRMVKIGNMFSPQCCLNRRL